MKKKDNSGAIGRREFVSILAAAAIGAPVFAAPGSKEDKKQAKSAKVLRMNERPSMTYRKLGRTNFMSSRLVFGCGAALAGGKAVRLLNRTFEAGINHYDIGSNVFYRGAEKNLAPFLKEHRDKIWVASKAPVFVRLTPDESITVQQAKDAAQSWLKLMDASLKDLGVDHVNAYYLMAVDNPSVIKSEEIHNAFQKAKAAGKVTHFGLSTHKNATKCLEAAIETGWYDVAMIGITPLGWYDWTTKGIEEGTPAMTKLAPLFERARNAGIGLVGMKTVRYIAPMSALGKGDTTAFDKMYDKKLKDSSLTPFQRSYAYVLEHGVDVVNGDMQNFKHLEENIVAAATSNKYFG